MVDNECTTLKVDPGVKETYYKKSVWYDFYFALLKWMLYWWEILGIDFFVLWCLNQDDYLFIDENYTTLTMPAQDNLRLKAKILKGPFTSKYHLNNI